MQKQVALIRGINVGTAKRVAMADLRQLVDDLGCTDVRTLLNSGNVVFTAPPKLKLTAAAQIQAGMARKLGVSAKVIAVSAKHFESIVAENPLAEVATEPTRLLVAFVHDPADLAKFAALATQTSLPEVLAVGSRAAYVWCPKGVLESKVFAAVNRFGDAVTTRNWATVSKLHAMLHA